MRKPHITSDMIKNATVLFAATFAGVKGFKAGCRGFEKLAPEIADKITVCRAAASALSSDDEDEYDDDDFEDDDD